MVMQVMMTMGSLFLGRQAALLASPMLPSLGLLFTFLGTGSCLAQPVSPLLHSVQAASRRCFLGVLATHTHTHTHTHTSGSQMTLRLLGTLSTPSYVSSGQWSRDAGGQGQEATWLQA